MDIKRNFENSFEGMKFVFDKDKYVIYSVIFGILSFSFLYYFLVAKVANNNLFISLAMSGPTFILISIANVFLTSILSAVLFSMVFFQYSNFKRSKKQGFFGFVGSGIAAFGFGCPTCGAFLFGIIGIPLALMYLPFRGLELQMFGIIVLIFSIYFTGKSIRGICKVHKV